MRPGGAAETAAPRCSKPGSVSSPITTQPAPRANSSVTSAGLRLPASTIKRTGCGNADQLLQEVALELPALDGVEVGDVALARPHHVAVGLHQGERVAIAPGCQDRLEPAGSARGRPPSRARPVPGPDRSPE